MIKITLPDGSVREMAQGASGLDIAKDISEGLARNVLAAKVNGEVWDATRPITTDAEVTLLTWKDQEGKNTFWHSSAHLLAEALEALYPGIKLGIGPASERGGFYYDIDFGEHKFSEDDFPKVEAKMKELAKQKNAYERQDISKADAIKYFQEKDDQYKLELLDRLEDGDITFYTQGGFTDLCRGPHIPNTGYIKAVKLLNVAGAYWLGQEDKPQLTRVNAITFPKAGELTEYLEQVEEAKRRDHRKLGQELDLFTFSERVGKGLPLWMPKGALLRDRLESFLKKAQMRAGYAPVVTPHIGSKELYVTSGHYEKYGEDSFQPINTPEEGEEYLLKPMNCPHHCEIYKARPRSYRDLPVRYAEFGTVYRYEQSGELHGLTRVRGFTQDDAHIFCRPDQVKDEFKKVIDLILYVFRSLGFKEFSAQVSLHDPENRAKYIGTEEQWLHAEQQIREAAKEKGLDTVEEIGEAAFYGPKLDFMVKDALGRSWQLGTVQVDYNLPQRFELEYVGADNEKHRPVMIHRAPFGSMERFISILIENTGGNFPLWLSPDQISILPISERFNEYAHSVYRTLEEEDIRGFVDDRDEKVGRKIRDSEVRKIPVMLIVGEKEVAENKVSVRKHGEGDVGVMTIEEFQHWFAKESKASLGQVSAEV
ncbi:MAG TPA: threonine--tRNA ligase [Cytophagales bacterium]|nr:threonine--tRNA ligase [Cytophagales bacterium]HAA21741.1 threonine--tRNA ligase [Cytophagales bacterium]HAP63597.1 threonine--tRNA ligase [Cytophagales bacterium]